jgi:hypothetical protein
MIGLGSPLGISAAADPTASRAAALNINLVMIDSRDWS